MWKKSILAIALLLAIAQVASASVQYTGQNEDGTEVPVTKDKASN
jgi:hypothetical protein